MARNAKRFIISLAIVLLVAYAAAMTVATVYFINKTGASGQRILSLELSRREMEKKINSVSEEITLLEQQRQELQETFNQLDSESKKKLSALTAEIEGYKGQVNDLKAGLTNAQRQATALKQENQKLQSSSSDKAGKKAGELSEALAEREAELVALNQKISSLEKEVKSKEAAVHYNLAVNFFERQDVENAVIEYEKALKIDPEHCPSHYNLGILFEEYKSDYPKAIKHYRQYLIHCPDADDAAGVKQWILDLESKTPNTTSR
ncbi:tetratricopeptide repeat protein [Candidatus Omnitrophota bacterium]